MRGTEVAQKSERKEGMKVRRDMVQYGARRRPMGVSVSVIEAVNVYSTSARCAGQHAPLSIPQSMAPGTFPIRACINGCCWHTAADWERIGFHFHFLPLLLSNFQLPNCPSHFHWSREEERGVIRKGGGKSPLMMKELIWSFTVSYAGLQKLSCQCRVLH